MISEKHEFRIGDRVRHPEFGEGDVIDVYSMQDDKVVVVSFERIGQKKIVTRFARLELISTSEDTESMLDEEEGSVSE
ncbi:MAG: hypothetical protein ACUVUU_08885 [bacterium]